MNCDIPLNHPCSEKVGKKLVAIINEVVIWYDYYAKHHTQESINRAYPQFGALEKIFKEYAELKGKENIPDSTTLKNGNVNGMGFQL